jgi:DNA helicase-2/ATP-dependent DNA helicase PcrA
VFPHARALSDDAELEEERRLCYVGMTRARQRLFLTSALSRRLYNTDSYNLPSRFLDEVPAELLEPWNGSGKRRDARAASREPRSAGREWRPAPSDAGVRGAGRPDEAEAPFVDHLQVGMRVRHAEWGVGVVKERIGEGEDLKVVITFAGVGRKKLAAGYVRLDRA